MEYVENNKLIKKKRQSGASCVCSEVLTHNLKIVDRRVFRTMEKKKYLTYSSRDIHNVQIVCFAALTCPYQVLKKEIPYITCTL